MTILNDTGTPGSASTACCESDAGPLLLRSATTRSEPRSDRARRIARLQGASASDSRTVGPPPLLEHVIR